MIKGFVEVSIFSIDIRIDEVGRICVDHRVVCLGMRFEKCDRILVGEMNIRQIHCGEPVDCTGVAPLFRCLIGEAPAEGRPTERTPVDQEVCDCDFKGLGERKNGLTKGRKDLF